MIATACTPRSRRSARRRVRVVAICGVALLATAALPAAAQATCPPDGYDIATLRSLRVQHFAVADLGRRQALALGLLACLASPDGEVRDQIGYEAFAYWRIARALDAATWSGVVDELQRRLAAPADAAGVAAPFAALVLAEAVHADRDAPFLDDARRRALLDAALEYFSTVRDYRGFDETTGWRHGVAHGADLLGELALEPAFDAAQLTRILQALAQQVVAHDDHVYVFGESERIAAAAIRVAGRKRMPAAAWKTWIAGIAAPAPFARWPDAYDSLRGFAKRQNTMNFLLALYAGLARSGDAGLRALAPGVGAAMRPLE